MHRDILIIGGGPVGLTLAVALAGSGLSCAVCEARPKADTRRPERTLALSHGTRLILERLGVWGHIEGSTPITAIDVSQRGAFGMTRMTAEDSGLPALGYVTSYRMLQAALEARSAECEVEVVYGARAEAITSTPAYARCELPQGATTVEATARLLVVADGGGEAWAGGPRRRHDYTQTAIVAEVTAEKPIPGMAFERFTSDGPVALLPFAAGYTLVWTASPARAAAIAALDDAAFRRALHAHFGDRVGEFEQVTNRRSFPLALEIALPRTATRMVAIGNAAQALHPVAGQGFNLGLRDAFELANLLRERDNSSADLRDSAGAREQLEAFARRRAVDRWSGVAFTHGLLAVFSSEHPAFALPRGLALMVLDTIPPFKRFFTQRMLYGA
jgi:2-octaprenyl-6-methoxyphenol hydroxylase